jgi:hypothetical protein
VAGVCLLASAGGTIIGRAVNHRGRLNPLTVTVVSMGIGALALLVSGLTVQGVPVMSPSAWLKRGSSWANDWE